MAETTPENAPDDPKNEPALDEGLRLVKVFAKPERGRWRAGVHWPRQWTLAAVDDDVYKALEQDAELSVKDASSGTPSVTLRGTNAPPGVTLPGQTWRSPIASSAGPMASKDPNESFGITGGPGAQAPDLETRKHQAIANKRGAQRAAELTGNDPDEVTEASPEPGAIAHAQNEQANETERARHAAQAAPLPPPPSPTGTKGGGSRPLVGDVPNLDTGPAPTGTKGGGDRPLVGDDAAKTDKGPPAAPPVRPGKH